MCICTAIPICGHKMIILITDAREYLFGFDWQRVQSVIYIYLCPTSRVSGLLLHQLMLIGQDILTNSNPNCCYWAHRRLIITPAEVRCQNYCINNWSPWLPSYCWTYQGVIFFKIFILPHITFKVSWSPLQQPSTCNTCILCHQYHRHHCLYLAIKFTSHKASNLA